MKKLRFLTQTALLFVIAVLGLSNVSYSQNILSSANANYEGIDMVDVKGSFCRVTITGKGDISSVDFKGEISGSGNSNVEIKYVREGNTLRVWIENNKGGYGNYGMNTKAFLDFTVPSKIKIVANNSSGSMVVSNISGSTCDLSASSGSVKASNIQTNMKVETSSGSISLEDIKGNVEGESTSGSQKMMDVSGNIQTVASSGSIQLGDVVGNIDARTTSGGIDLDNIKGSLKLEATSGSIRGEIIELQGNADFETTSGSVNIDFTNDLKELSFTLSASSGGLQVGDNRAGDTLILKQGALQVSGESSSGSQKYY